MSKSVKKSTPKKSVKGYGPRPFSISGDQVGNMIRNSRERMGLSVSDCLIKANSFAKEKGLAEIPYYTWVGMERRGHGVSNYPFILWLVENGFINGGSTKQGKEVTKKGRASGSRGRPK